MPAPTPGPRQQQPPPRQPHPPPPHPPRHCADASVAVAANVAAIVTATSTLASVFFIRISENYALAGRPSPPTCLFASPWTKLDAPPMRTQSGPTDGSHCGGTSVADRDHHPFIGRVVDRPPLLKQGLHDLLDEAVHGARREAIGGEFLGERFRELLA